MKFALCWLILFLALIPVAQAENPIVVGQGLTDPKVRVYGDHVFLYATHDADPQAKKFLMNDWWTWSSDDLVHWKYESTLQPEQTYWGKPCNSCWATDATSRHGKYYFYFSRGDNELGVVRGDTPTGPWIDPLHKPLVASGSVATKARDPAILQENDGTTYLIFGCWDYYIARLSDDMVTLAETPHKVEIEGKMGPYGAGKTDDKSYLHKYNGKYYLSWGCFYAMSDNVYGPYVYKGCIITKERTEPAFQKDLVQDRHASFFELHHQWYFICNDQSWPGTTGHYRDSIITYLHYLDNGEIDPVFIERIGVGQYDAGGKIEAENYSNEDGVTPKQCPSGGFELQGIHDGSHADYPNVMNLPANATVSFRASAANPPGATIEVRKQSPLGALLGTARIPSTGHWTTYQTVSCSLTNEAGSANLCLVFRGPPGELLHLDSFGFQQN